MSRNIFQDIGIMIANLIEDFRENFMNSKYIRLTEDVVLDDGGEIITFKKGCVGTISWGRIEFDENMLTGLYPGVKAVYPDDILTDSAFVGKYEEM